MISDIRTKKDYKKEIKKIEEKLFKVNNEKKELIMLRLRKEIDLQDYNIIKDDLESRIKSMEEDKLKLIKEEKEKFSEKSFNEFKEKLISIIFSDDEKVLELAQTFFEDIKVESVKNDETKQKIILHAKLNVFNREDEIFDLENFLLLFCKHPGCGDCLS